MDVGERLAKLEPKNSTYVLERAYGHSGLASVLESKGDFANALKHYRVSVEVKEELARRDPDDANAQAEVARAYNKVGAVEYNMGDLRGALRHSQREVAIYRQLLVREPKQNQWRQRLASSMGYLGRALVETGDSGAAFALWQEELAIERQLAALDPSNVDCERAVAMTARRMADAEAGRSERASAAAYFKESRARIGDAVRHAKTRTSFAVDAAFIDIEYARYLASTGDRRRAVDLLHDVLLRLEPMRESERSAHVHLASAALLLGELDPRSQRTQWKRAESELEPLMSADAAPTELAIWFKVLVHRNRLAVARTVLDRIQRTGYDTSDLQQFCRERGC
jgi:tetratricopeptide (TPR) repeat protein